MRHPDPTQNINQQNLADTEPTPGITGSHLSTSGETQGINMSTQNRQERYDRYNAQDKRFVISPNEFGLKRLDAVQRSIDSIKAKRPEVLSLVVFGSTVKGESHHASDIDGYIFINPSLSQSQDLPVTDGSTATRLKSEVADRYTNQLRNRIMDKTKLTPDQVAGIKVLPINEEIINKQVDDLVDVINKLKNYELEREKRELEFLASNPNGIYLESPPNGLMPPIPKPNLFAMFHLEIGGGIRNYRNYLIERLEQEGDSGEVIWKEIIEATEMMEQNMSYNTNKRYPRNLTEAREVYGFKKQAA